MVNKKFNRPDFKNKTEELVYSVVKKGITPSTDLVAEHFTREGAGDDEIATAKRLAVELARGSARCVVYDIVGRLRSTELMKLAFDNFVESLMENAREFETLVNDELDKEIDRGGLN